MNFWKALIANPIAKTIVVNAAAGAVTALDVALQHPTGGLAAALTSSPQYGLVYLLAQNFVHNLASSATFTQTRVTEPVAITPGSPKTT